MNCIERLTNELKNLRKQRKYKFYAKPIDKTLKKWECGIPGPASELYSKAYYTIYLKFPSTYPFNPPKAEFKHQVFHPNVYSNRSVCLDLIGDKWKPSVNVQQVLVGIQQLLIMPNIYSPANCEASNLLDTSKKEYSKRVKENIKKYHSTEPW